MQRSTMHLSNGRYTVCAIFLEFLKMFYEKSFGVFLYAKIKEYSEICFIMHFTLQIIILKL